MREKAIAIITARGGSKRIPNKNIREFCGKPIIAYSIQAAIESNIFDEIMVSTDSYVIAEIAQKYGARVPFMRSDQTADDYATTSDVILEVLRNYEKMGRTFEYISCIYPTAPFVTGGKLKSAMKIIETNDCVEVMPVVEFSYPPQRCYVIENDKMHYKYPEYSEIRSQDLEKYYHDAGQFYFYRTDEYLVRNGKIKGDVYPLIVSTMEVQDIDNESDWKIAEIKYKLINSK